MLINLHVKNLALIEEADINFFNGLNILTGETGAGKSILIGSINVALGGKVSSDFIRKGAEYGLVELTFQVKNDSKLSALRNMDIMELEEGIVIISRKILPNRTILKVNGETKTISEVKEIASLLIDIHGQHEHQSLLYKKNYLSIIDKYAGVKILELKDKLKVWYNSYIEGKKKLNDFSMDVEQLNREVSYIEFELKEIDEAAIRTGEDEELEKLFKKFNNSKTITENINEAHDCLVDREDSVSSLISYAYKNIAHAYEKDEELSDIFSQIRDIEDLINGLSTDISQYMDEMEYDEEQYTYVNDRLSLINNLKLKYGNTIEEINKYYDSRQIRLKELLNYEDNRMKAEKELAKAKDNVLSLCSKISAVRKEVSGKMADDIKNALLELNFLDVRFEISVTNTESFNENGYDEIDFLISTNPGEEIKPLAKVASGGELSRIMLAIKTVLADKDDIEALIFDEIDTGISGRTAQMVSVKLDEIATTHQVICITHLPQIASMADEHYLIEKNVNNGNNVITNITKLDYDSSISELARLLGGVSITENVVNNAKEMKELALQSKSTKIIK